MKIALHYDPDKVGPILSFAEDDPPHKTFWVMLPERATAAQVAEALERTAEAMREHSVQVKKGPPVLTVVD